MVDRLVDTESWDASQQQILDLAGGKHGPTLVFGGARSGKTRLTVQLALQFLQQPEATSERILILSPSRNSSARLRDEIESRWAQLPLGGALTEEPSRSFASYAFWILGRARQQNLLELAGRNPRLLSGAEQDQLIKQLFQDEAGPLLGVTEQSTLAQAATTDAFRKELRELFDRAAEYGVSPDTLIEWGNAAQLAEGPGLPEWTLIGNLYEQYRQNLKDSDSGAFDPAGLINAACGLLEQNPEFLAEIRDGLDLVLVDDIHEGNPNVFRLLRLIGAGQPVIAFANPDTTTEGFRGARPDRLGSWTAAPKDATTTEAGITVCRSGSMQPNPEVKLTGAPAHSPLTLTGPHQADTVLGTVYGRVIERLGSVTGAADQRRPYLELAATETARIQLARGEVDAERQTLLNHPEDVDTAALSAAAYVTGSHYHAEQLVLQEVLDRHRRTQDGEPISFSQIAVIARNGSEVQSLSRVLTSHGVPVRRQMSDVVLREEMAVAPLLSIVHAVTHPDQEQLTATEVRWLLTGPYGGLDSLGLRQLEQHLLAAERELVFAAPNPEKPLEARTAEQLLVDITNNDDDPVLTHVVDKSATPRARQGAAQQVVHTLRRVAAMVGDARRYVAQHGSASDTTMVLWSMWNASGRAEPWREQALRGGEAAETAHRNLDAVIALFQTAERYITQIPDATAWSFVDFMEAMELPMDSLSETSGAADAVSILTPASAAGQHFNTVILAGLQEGTWPNLTPRGELLGATRLVDMVENPENTAMHTTRAKRLQVLQDEYRLFAAAVSRAEHRLVGIAVNNTEEAPSPLLDLIVDPVHRTSSQLYAPQAPTAQNLTAGLRRHLEILASQGETDPAAASGLARLAQPMQHPAEPHRQVSLTGAAPETWWGMYDPAQNLPLVTDEELDSQEPAVVLRPSQLTAAVEEPLQWFTQAVGATEQSDLPRMLGTLIHSIAEEHPDPKDKIAETTEVLVNALGQRWHELNLPETWESQLRWQSAKNQMKVLAGYLHSAKSVERKHLISEVLVRMNLDLPFRGQHRSVQVAGKIDRLESTPQGHFIVDYKTGTSKPRRCDLHPDGSKQTPRAECDLCKHLQLGVYQLMVNSEEFRTAAEQQGVDLQPEAPIEKAALLQLATSEEYAPKNNLYQQDSIYEVEDDFSDGMDTWVELALAQAAEHVTGANFTAFHKPSEHNCRIGVFCPHCEQGKQVTQP